MTKHTHHVYEVTGNTTPRRLGKVFPTGWTPLAPENGGTVQIAARTQWPNSLRGTRVSVVGTIELPDLVRRQMTVPRRFAGNVADLAAA